MKTNVSKKLMNEKLEIYGNTAIETLSTAETISLCTGISLDKLFEYNNPHDLFSDIDHLSITKLQASKLYALKHLLSLANSVTTSKKITINSPSNTAAVLYDAYLLSDGTYDKESFKLLSLSNSNTVISIDTISIGTVNSTLVSPREVILKALSRKAVNIIVSHNHPSSKLDPSQNDIEVTKKLNKACKNLDLNLLDHIIIDPKNRKQFYSFKEGGLL